MTKLLKGALGALSAAVGVVVLAGFVLYESMGREDGGSAMEPLRGRVGGPVS